tara:strand:+ start:244 stop:420 length:177 start_codon:yes stop_codon:yes gene_type:complete
MFADYDEFYNGIADVQFFYGERPDEGTVNHILTEGWKRIDLNIILRKELQPIYKMVIV